jgi:hypothetical protein
LLETVHERCEAGLPIRTVRSGIHKGANAPHPLGLLRARRERPGSRRATEQPDELAPLHSITPSARASIKTRSSMRSGTDIFIFS